MLLIAAVLAVLPAVLGRMHGMYVWTEDRQADSRPSGCGALGSTVFDPRRDADVDALAAALPAGAGGDDALPMLLVNGWPHLLPHAAVGKLARGAAVYALFTSPDVRLVDKVARANAGAGAGERYAGIALNDERYTSLDAHREVVQAAHKVGLKVHCSLGFWWKTNDEAVQVCDSVDVQAYFTDPATVVKVARPAVDLARKAGKPVFIAMETDDVSFIGPCKKESGTALLACVDRYSWFRKGHAAMERAADSVAASLDVDGFILHYWRRFVGAGGTGVNMQSCGVDVDRLWPVAPVSGGTLLTSRRDFKRK